MHTTRLRKVGGSVMLAVPPAILDMLRLQPGASVGLRVDDDRLVIEATKRKTYTLDELLAACDPHASPDAEDRAWLDAPPIGDEIL